MKHTIPSYYERVKEGAARRDFFNREDFKDNLTNLLSSTEDSLTITINADWGEGKTTFIKLWKDELEESEQFIPIYYDAFENDFASDAFISIAVTIQKAIANITNNSCEDDFEDYKKATVDLGIELTKMAVNTAVKVTTGGVLAADSFYDWISGEYKKRKEDKEKAEIRGSKELIESKYDAFFNKEKLIRNYHAKLKELLEEQGEKKIIFFVDELDRCRPSFAIQVLEKIKHLFSISHVNFVLAINREQLVEIIEHAYGVNEDDAYVYLQKFVHVGTKLPTLKDLRTTDEQKLKLFIEELVGAFQIPDDTFDAGGFYTLIKKSLAQIDYTPRSIERTLTLFSISISSCRKEKKKRLFRHVLLLSLLKVHVRPIYEDAKGNDRVMKGISSQDVNVGPDFISYLGSASYFGSTETSKSGNHVKIKNLKEAAKIVDIYDLPPESVEDILSQRVPPEYSGEE